MSFAAPARTTHSPESVLVPVAGLGPARRTDSLRRRRSRTVLIKREADTLVTAEISIAAAASIGGLRVIGITLSGPDGFAALGRGVFRDNEWVQFAASGCAKKNIAK